MSSRWRGGLGRLRRLPGAFERIRRNQAVLAWAVAELQAQRDAANPGPAGEAGPIRSEHCTQAGCTGPAFVAWCDRLGIEPSPDRWRWEKVFIVRTLHALDRIGPGRRGLGFGVGGEPLVAYFASEGCEVVATDLDPADPRTGSWGVDGEAPGSGTALERPAICTPEEFAARVSMRAVDMAAVPDDLQGFDFCWSACALEHLGSLDAGIRFIEASLECLRPGGVAIHTTELNVGSTGATIETGPTVLYRRADLEALVDRLGRQRHTVAPLDLEPRFGVLDLFESDEPHLSPPALRVVVDGHLTTTVALVITRG